MSDVTSILRPCQEVAIKTVIERRTNNDTDTNLSLCTGAGKSIIIREITKGTERLLLVFPWLDLLTQFYDEHKDTYRGCTCIRYLATEGTLRDVQRMSADMNELKEKHYVIFTTYTSAPLLFNKLTPSSAVDLLIHDEAHRVERAEYKLALSKVSGLMKHTVNLSATLPESKIPHYKYPLLRGIKDGVVRDFHMELFLCVQKERSETKLLQTIIENLLSLHKEVKLLVYTAEANTEGDTSSSVKTFMDKHSEELRSQGWWTEGINEETKDRKKLLREFEKPREVSILVSCKTLTEGIDLKGANCVLPWDPSASVKDNIQRIGRVLRLYKTEKGVIKKEQPASTVLIPVFLQEQKYLECGGDKEKINALLCREISEGERGNFRPIVSVCTALKEELAEEDEELFNRLMNYPYEPKVAVNRNMLECVAKECKKSTEIVLEDVVEALEGKVDEEQLEMIKEGEWDDEVVGEVAQALAETQKLTLVVRDGEEADIFGNGKTQLTLEKKVGDEGYKVVRGARAAAEKQEAKKRIAQRLRVEISDDCKVLLGLDSIADTDTTAGMILSRLTTEVQYDDNWEQRRLEWVAFTQTNQRGPKQKSGDRKEERLAQWQNVQRRLFKNSDNRLTPERVVILNDNYKTPGWKWEEEDTWESNRQNWINQAKKIGRCPSSISKNHEEKRAGKWQSHQRDNHNNGKLSSERYVILNDPIQTPGWKWKEEDTWELKRQQWIRQYKKYNDCPKGRSEDVEERHAGQWQQQQRTLNKEGNLRPERFAILNDSSQTPGWKWEEGDVWEENRQNWLSQVKALGRLPYSNSDETNEKRAGQWQIRQRCDKRRNTLTNERFAVLNDPVQTPGWKWEEGDVWEQNRLNWNRVFKSKGGNYPTQRTLDESEKSASQWQSQQRKAKKKGEKWLTPERIKILESTPGWSWSSDEQPKTPYIPPESPQPTPAPRVRKFIKILPKKDEKSSQARQLSKFEAYHQRFKTMNAATYKASVKPEEFEDYHALADSYDARDPPERQPINKVATLLAKFNKPSYKAVDLGCGKNRLRIHDSVSKMSWTSVDVHAVDETVTVADMGALPYEEESFDIAVLSRSLWAKNHMTVLEEAYRILKCGGRAVICESFRRWLKQEESGVSNTLVDDLKTVGFEIIFEEGTQESDTEADVFQYIVARKC